MILKDLPVLGTLRRGAAGRFSHWRKQPDDESETTAAEEKHPMKKSQRPTCLAVFCLLFTSNLHCSLHIFYLCKQHDDGGACLFSHSPGDCSF